jgi:hypothetical protein
MTEYNIFCYSKKYNDKDSFQQKKFRAFNKEVSEKRYNEIYILIKKILPKKDLKLSDFWESVTPEQWKKLLEIPEASDFKEGFEYISDVKIPEFNSLKGKEVSLTIDNKIYKAIIQ